MSNEFRIFGPPGAGKTTYLSKQIQRALYKYHPDEVVACSFTKAAAVELASADTGLPEQNIGTIHALCYRRLGTPTITETDPDLISEWNQAHPYWQIECEGAHILDETPGRDSDELMDYNRYRARLREGGHSPGFAEAWEAFKQETGSLDFTDLLLNAPESIDARVLIVDEAQDLTPLQWCVVRRWGESVDTFLVAGDDDQLLYNFLGATPEAFLTPLHDENIRVLGHSYRLPRAVWEWAEAWISRLEGRRQPKDYEPRGEGGSVREAPYRFDQPEALLDAVEEQASAGKTVMLLATCAYMLRPIISGLRDRGLPYHNPYRAKRGDWNPMRTTGARLLSFLTCAARLRSDGRFPPADVWWPWIEMLRAKNTLQYGGKSAMRVQASKGLGLTEDDIFEILEAPTIEAVLNADIEWVCRNTTARFAKAVEYPLRIWKHGGEDALRETPRIIVGTIHSVKGGQSDVVYMAPDMSFEAWRGLKTGGARARDALIRQAYVGGTRAREELVLCSPSKRFKWHWKW